MGWVDCDDMLHAMAAVLSVCVRVAIVYVQQHLHRMVQTWCGAMLVCLDAPVSVRHVYAGTCVQVPVL